MAVPRIIEDAASYKRVVRNFELCSAEKQSLQLLVNHLQLQTSALQSKNRELVSVADQLRIDVAELEERDSIQQVHCTALHCTAPPRTRTAV